MNQSLELKLGLLACLVFSGLYVVYDLTTEPSGGHPIGYMLGVVGALLMVSTETLYSLRKRIGWLRGAGPLRWWLSVHIFTGIVGPFLVLMHTGLKFQGVAGFTMALTVLVVASGFFGRYLYTAVPRSLAGTEATAAELGAELQRVHAALNQLAGQQSAAVQALVDSELRRPGPVRGDLIAVLLRVWDDWRYRNQLRHQTRQLEKPEKHSLDDIERLLVQRHNLERQTHILDAARRMFGLWHVVHIPMGLALFGSVAVHVVATLYLGAGI